jgi:hypothetical protein
MTILIYRFFSHYKKNLKVNYPMDTKTKTVESKLNLMH